MTSHAGGEIPAAATALPVEQPVDNSAVPSSAVGKIGAAPEECANTPEGLTTHSAATGKGAGSW